VVLIEDQVNFRRCMAALLDRQLGLEAAAQGEHFT